MGEAVRKVLLEHGKLAVDVSELKDDQDLYRSGMTSHASVSVMLALEEEFDLEFPENMLRKSTFESVSSIRAALVQVAAESERTRPA